MTASDWLLMVTPVLLVVPNVILDVTEDYMTWPARALNVLLPLSFFYLLISAFRRPQAGVFCSLPFMILSAFEIVLLYLYGGSVIAVDMFLNVFTTSYTEATDLLAFLTTAICAVCALYLPPLIAAAFAVARHSPVSVGLRNRVRGVSLCCTSALAVLTIIYSSCSDRFVIDRDIFPVNAIANACESVQRIRAVGSYHDTSAGFKYDAVSTHAPCEREIYVLVIGETSRAGNWQLCGYPRRTNPRLSCRDGVVAFKRAVSQSNTTHKSVPMLMTAVTASDYDSISHVKSLITAFKEAGFYTVFYSNQPPNHSYNQFFGEEADCCKYLQMTGQRHPYDGEMVKLLSGQLNDTTHLKLLVVMHTYGSHFAYSDRYPEEMAYFKPDRPCRAESGNRPTLINAYDNTIIYTDAVIDGLIGQLARTGARAALLYASDHGEDIFDDGRGRFLHASPTPTYNQLHCAMLAWTSQKFKEENPHEVSLLACRDNVFVSPSEALFHTLIDAAGISTPYYDSSKSLLSREYREPRAIYVTDRNACVALEASGIKEQDKRQFQKLRILANDI